MPQPHPVGRGPLNAMPIAVDLDSPARDPPAVRGVEAELGGQVRFAVKPIFGGRFPRHKRDPPALDQFSRRRRRFGRLDFGPIGRPPRLSVRNGTGKQQRENRQPPSEEENFGRHVAQITRPRPRRDVALTGAICRLPI